MRTLDADGHIFEPEAMFAQLEAEFYPRRPILVTLPLDTAAGEGNAVWLVDGKMVPQPIGQGRTFPGAFPGSASSQNRLTPLGDQTLEDVEARLKGMDHFGIDEQVIYPTMFLQASYSDVRLEAALCRAYNDYVSDACGRSHGRLKWTALVPWRDTEAAAAEVARASDMGAAGIYTMGVIVDRQLNHPAFFPIYQAASERDLPVCVHLGWGAPAVTDLFAEATFFCSATVPVIWGFVSIMQSGLLGRFPRLRVGFIETGAGWVPYAIHKVRRQAEPVTVLRDPQSRRRLNPGRVNQDFYRDPLEWFHDGRAFVTCESDEDIPYLVAQLGEDSIMFSSDYPHGDQSADERFADTLRMRTDLHEGMKAKLLGGNAARFYRV